MMYKNSHDILGPLSLTLCVPSGKISANVYDRLNNGQVSIMSLILMILNTNSSQDNNGNECNDNANPGTDPNADGNIDSSGSSDGDSSDNGERRGEDCGHRGSYRV